jgi:hypothetical protein
MHRTLRRGRNNATVETASGRREAYPKTLSLRCSHPDKSGDNSNAHALPIDPLPEPAQRRSTRQSSTSAKTFSMAPSGCESVASK